jgi:hypothetical protein
MARNNKVYSAQRVIRKLDDYAKRTDDILIKCVEVGADTAEPIVREKLTKSIGKGAKDYSTGELLASLGVTKGNKHQRGKQKNKITAKVGFKEPRKNQLGSGTSGNGGKASYNSRTNAMVANVLEYGRHSAGSPPQTPHPFIKPAKRTASPLVRMAIQETFDKETRTVFEKVVDYFKGGS